MAGLCNVVCTILLLSLFSVDVQGDISLPSFGDLIYVSKGSNVTLEWTYKFPGKTIAFTQWAFGDVKTGEVLAHFSGGNITITNSSLPNIDVIKPATLVLKNVSLDYNGTYSLTLTVPGVTTPPSVVRVIIVVPPLANISCTTLVNLTEGDNLSCICSGVRGSPPPTAYWFKDNNPAPITKRYLTAPLDQRNVSKNDIGTYTCRVRSGNLIDEQRINVTVLYGPTSISFTSNVTNNTTQVGEYVKLTCSADGNPKSSYTITFVKNGTVELRNSSEGMLIIKNTSISDNGTFRCVAKNNRDSIEAELVLDVTEIQPTTTTPTTVPASSTNTTTASSSVPTTVTATATAASTKSGGGGSSDKTILIIIVVICCCCGVLVVIIVVVVYRKKRSCSGSHKSRNEEQENVVANPTNANYAAMANAMEGNPYESVDAAKLEQARADEAGPSNENPPDAGDSMPPVYAVVDKSKKTPKPPPLEKKPDSVTYASLDPVLLQPDSSKMRARTREETNYASIDLEQLKKEQK